MRLSGSVVIPVIFGILFTGIIPLSYAGPPTCIGNIDFDFFPDGTPVPNETKLTNQYAVCGVALFTTTDPLGPSIRDFASLYASSAPNLLLPQPKNTEDPIGIEFVSPVTEASINALGVGFNGLILDALDSGGSIVDTVSVVHPGTPEGTESLTVSGDGIVKLLIHQITPGGKQGLLIDGYGIDDLTFTLSSSPPPPTLQEQINALTIAIQTILDGIDALIDTMAAFDTALNAIIDAATQELANLQTQIDDQETRIGDLENTSPQIYEVSETITIPAGATTGGTITLLCLDGDKLDSGEVNFVTDPVVFMAFLPAIVGLQDTNAVFIHDPASLSSTGNPNFSKRIGFSVLPQLVGSGTPLDIPVDVTVTILCLNPQFLNPDLFN